MELFKALFLIIKVISSLTNIKSLFTNVANIKKRMNKSINQNIVFLLENNLICSITIGLIV